MPLISFTKVLGLNIVIPHYLLNIDKLQPLLTIKEVGVCRKKYICFWLLGACHLFVIKRSIILMSFYASTAGY